MPLRLLAASLFLLLVLPARATSPVAAAGPQPIDPTVTPGTRALLRNLHHIGWETDTIMFGQEFPLSYDKREVGYLDPDQSDIKDVTGDHPAVHGSDFHFLIDKDRHEIFAHTRAAQKAYANGAMVTFDYHWLGKYGGTHNWHEEDAKILHHVVTGDDSSGDVTWFYTSLDQVLRIINEDLQFPIVFRPLHEMNGNWFWWGSRLEGGPETYVKAYRLLVDYMRERTDYVLFCWSPDKALATEYYPGDDYVDIVGVDGYGEGNPHNEHFTVEAMVTLLEQTVDFAAAHGKVAAFTETGYHTWGEIAYHTEQPDWWTRSVLEPILASEKASRIAWVLSWINSHWSGPYTPHAESPEASKAAFRAFHADPHTLFQKDVARLKLYD
ncbi:glycoside hydrolase family 26 protein [Synoicihabitans lomoniglobus]|uniref:Glycosyl hydrolase n=1 Tax=Synoicihabitans lomoniglobus TaxID=2909285 RepID=A0AAF0CGB2_9BACT|nr:glycoside hydrolase family 26 protein [Opitutaceae bacterium LMO-M01]WED63377.1 glycosyl hydrolase [Opitutaceae bacterium LMO-M01]